mgnify:CR=1 FL=1
MNMKLLSPLALILIASSPVFAAERNAKMNHDVVRTSSAATRSNVNMSDVDVGFGLTTVGQSGLSLNLDMSQTTNLQIIFGMGVGSSSSSSAAAIAAALAGVPASSSTVTLGGGGIFRYTLIGDRKLGFHAGGGTVLGTNGANFFIKIIPTVGFHWVFLEHIGVHVDMGPNFQILASSPAAFSFSLGEHGSPFGLSLHYYF